MHLFHIGGHDKAKSRSVRVNGRTRDISQAFTVYQVACKHIFSCHQLAFAADNVRELFSYFGG